MNACGRGNPEKETAHVNVAEGTGSQTPYSRLTVASVCAIHSK